tara:strand:- start:7725 stop:8699 length:975 start_codon:yes stop_codon:yes gene_type:complete
MAKSLEQQSMSNSLALRSEYWYNDTAGSGASSGPYGETTASMLDRYPNLNMSLFISRRPDADATTNQSSTNPGYLPFLRNTTFDEHDGIYPPFADTYPSEAQWSTSMHQGYPDMPWKFAYTGDYPAGTDSYGRDIFSLIMRYGSLESYTKEWYGTSDASVAKHVAGTQWTFRVWVKFRSGMFGGGNSNRPTVSLWIFGLDVNRGFINATKTLSTINITNNYPQGKSTSLSGGESNPYDLPTNQANLTQSFRMDENPSNVLQDQWRSIHISGIFNHPDIRYISVRLDLDNGNHGTNSITDFAGPGLWPSGISLGRGGSDVSLNSL